MCVRTLLKIRVCVRTLPETRQIQNSNGQFIDLPLSNASVKFHLDPTVQLGEIVVLLNSVSAQAAPAHCPENYLKLHRNETKP